MEQAALHGRCNGSKGARLTAAAYELADGHRVAVLDFLAACEHPLPAPPGSLVHLLTPRRLKKNGLYCLSVDRVGCKWRALCGHDLGLSWAAVHGEPGKPQNATCRRCSIRREQLGAATAPACPGACCST